MRRPPRKRRTPGTRIQLAQILVLVVLLVAILTMRVRVGELASRMLDAFSGPDDVKTTPSGPDESQVSTDAGTP
ncbi:MAG: hypothetical protein R3E66_11780 [bacterium]